jgi:RTA1 like protein
VYEGANFLTLGRILYYIPYHSPIHPGRVFTTFVAMGAAIESITGNGASLIANSKNSQSQQNTGKDLIKASMIMQLALMAGFVGVTLRFMYNCSAANLLTRNVKRPLIVLLISCTIITARTIYRTVEYYSAASITVGTTHVSPILTNEWFFWVFEATLMFSNTALLNIFHPMELLPRSNMIYLSSDGVTEVEGPGYNDPRPFFLTLFDPFDLTGLIMRKNRNVNYWENTDSAGVGAEKDSSNRFRS